MTCADHGRAIDAGGVCAECEASEDRASQRAVTRRWFDGVRTLDGLLDLPEDCGMLAGDPALRMPRGDVTHHRGRIRRVAR